jgi:hypothetical protein
MGDGLDTNSLSVKFNDDNLHQFERSERSSEHVKSQISVRSDSCDKVTNKNVLKKRKRKQIEPEFSKKVEEKARDLM